MRGYTNPHVGFYIFRNVRSRQNVRSGHPLDTLPNHHLGFSIEWCHRAQCPPNARLMPDSVAVARQPLELKSLVRIQVGQLPNPIMSHSETSNPVKNLRTYGAQPFGVAVLHGGPGAPGGMAPVALELSSLRGVLEPLQSASSVEGQVQELCAVLDRNADLPVTLIGWSWGAWLGFIVAARYPSFVRKLILIGSGSFEDAYAQRIMETRLSRLSEAERAEVLILVEDLEAPAGGVQPAALARFGALMSKADTYDPLPHQPLPHESEGVEVQDDVYQRVWREAAGLRNSGRLLAFGEKIQCPVVAIHGDYDPHPFEGVRDPLSRVLRDFRFILLENCGHEPLFERAARDEFYRTLKDELE